MNIVYKLTLRHLKSNLKRTIVTIFGIVASTALITAMLVGIYSVFSFVADVSLLVDGNQHANFKNLTEDEYLKLKNNENLKFVGVTDTDNEITGFYIDGDAQKRFRIGNIYHGDSENLSQMVTCEYEGRLPENPGEIAIEEEFLTNNNLSLTIGDSLNFHEGYRCIYENDELVYLAGAYRSNEDFVTKTDENCTITAILHNNEPTSSFDIIRGMDEFPAQNLVYITLKKPDMNAVINIRKIAEENNLKIDALATEYLMCIFARELRYNTVKAIFRLIGLALFIIIIASSIMIYNAFAMSLTERMKYLGMLSSVGATRRQKKASVYFEGFILGIIGLPLGFLAGLIGCLVTLRITGSLIISSGMIRGVVPSMGHIPLRFTPAIFLAIVFFSAITIFISSFIPAVKASRVTAIEAIRQSNSIKLRAWKLKVLPFVKMFFGYEGELASKNIKRNGAKGVIITLSMAVSVIMFLSIIYFVDLFNKENSYEIDIPFQIFASASLSESDRLKEELLKTNGVEKIYVAEMFSFDFNPTDENGNLREIPNTAILNPDYLTKDYKRLFDKISDIWIVPVEDDDFIEICKKNNIDPDKYFGGELNGLLLNNFNHKRSRKNVFNDNILGQKVFYDKTEGNPPAVTITDLVKWDNSVDEFKLSPKGSISIYVPVSVFRREYIKNIDIEKLSCTYGIKCENHEEMYGKISDLLTFGGYTNTSCSDIESDLMVMKTLLTMLKTVMYGFTALISLIVIANIINTITTGVHLRKKEFAMYKSVGMTEFGFKKMLFLETFLYGFRALIIGFPISALLSFITFKALAAPSSAFEINFFVYLLAAVGVFAIVGISMLLAGKTLKHDSIIEVLKEDIC